MIREMLFLEHSGRVLCPAGNDDPRKSDPRLAKAAPPSKPVAADGTRRIHSFFDVLARGIPGRWRELDARRTGGASESGLQRPGKFAKAPRPNLPPPDGQYVSPQLYHILTAQGIVISKYLSQTVLRRASRRPPPGATDTHTFNSQVEMDLSQQGQPPQHVSAPGPRSQ